jgi:hypothetical protein
MIITTFEQFKNLPKNKGRDSKVVYKEWLFEEAKLQMVYDAYTMNFQMQFNNYTWGVYGPAGSTTGASETPFVPPIPVTGVTYFTPNGSSGLPLGYYTPDLNDLINSYYIYV